MSKAPSRRVSPRSSVEKFGGRHHASPASENGLDQNRADVARLKSAT